MQITCIKLPALLSSGPVNRRVTRLWSLGPLIQTGQRWTGAVLIVAIFWALTLTVSPQLHELIHPDADHEDHDCAVTLFLGGGLVHSPLLPSLVAGPLVLFLRHTPSPPPDIFAVLFAGQRISERGPPLISVAFNQN
jgi:drug/metabolite transporter (DMT)-like permease